MEKIRNVSYKDWQRIFFLKETSLVYPTLKTLPKRQRKRKTYDANDLLVLSLVSIITYIYILLEKKVLLYICKSNDIVLRKTF